MRKNKVKKETKEAEQHPGGEKWTDKTLSHICTIYLWEQVSGKVKKGEEEGCGVGFPVAVLFSPAAARGVSGRRFQAPTRWLPDFQSQAPAGTMREKRYKH